MILNKHGTFYISVYQHNFTLAIFNFKKFCCSIFYSIWQCWIPFHNQPDNTQIKLFP